MTAAAWEQGKTPARRDPARTQDRADICAAAIAIVLGLAMIGYGAGWNLDLFVTVAVIAAAFGSTARHEAVRLPGPRPGSPRDGQAGR